MTEKNLVVNIDDMLNKLEPLIRRIIREELKKFIEGKRNIFYLDPDMPLYQDMEEISCRKSDGEIKLYSDEEVWNE